MPGSEETRTAERCGQEERDCNDACEWNEWELVVPGEGVCEPGWERVSSEACAEGLERAETCAEDCTWQGGPCIDECGDTPVREPLLAMEVCVPAGLFIRGGDTYPDTDPEATVRLSAYYIDRYPATNARYRECVDARACDRPSVDGWDWFDDETLANSPVTGLTWAQARAFCQWMDRRLPTEAEWEKAARGPYPNRRAWPWGNTWDCDVLDADLCDDRSYGSGRPLVAVDSAPELASPFGTELQAGGAYEWTSDYYDAEYYSRMSSREDPTGPSAPSRPDLGHVLRGQPSYAVQEGDDLTQRSARGEDRGLVQEGVRCARTPGE